jgi:hypothetical protein
MRNRFKYIVSVSVEYTANYCTSVMLKLFIYHKIKEMYFVTVSLYSHFHPSSCIEYKTICMTENRG